MLLRPDGDKSKTLNDNLRLYHRFCPILSDLMMKSVCFMYFVKPELNDASNVVSLAWLADNVSLKI
ncbi:hypothetical protein BFW38_13875 [Terasakiispira papahanaumokuakeensis]|uniref:Uncharacterized protein n=1 Tax=Terasakiispira papahanaumokuakeensis TaxID=197479 RepID=A0A1E2VBT0_9GAMM|nr:hypothetical protein BFW38_13875 [Terasakiispira papahanaumokuakeensis]